MAGFPHLPGVTVNLADLGLKISPPPQGPKVTLLGITSNTGVPLREPFIVTSVGKAAASLYFSGHFYNADASNPEFNVGPGELSLAIEEAIQAGAGAVEVVVIGHHHGDELTDILFSPGTGISGSYTRYLELQEAYDQIVDTDLDIVVPVGAYADDTGVSGGFMTQLANFCHQATSEAGNACVGVIGLMPINMWAINYGTGLLTSFEDEIASTNRSGDLYFAKPSLALTTEWYRYVTQQGGPTITDATTNFPPAFGAFLGGSEDIDGTFYPTNDENEATNVNANYFAYWQAVDSEGSAELDGKGNKVDAGRRICVFGGPFLTANQQVKDLAKSVGASVSNTTYLTNGVAAYAGLLTKLPPHSAASNKTIPNLIPQRTLSATQANVMAARRITTMINRPKGFVVTSAVTGAHNVSKYVRSDFVRLSTVRVVDATIEIIREVGDRFIGEPNSAAHRNALAAEIDKVLNQMKVAQALNDYQFFVSASPENQVLGEIVVDLTLVPAFETVKININVALASEIT